MDEFTGYALPSLRHSGSFEDYVGGEWGGGGSAEDISDERIGSSVRDFFLTVMEVVDGCLFSIRGEGRFQLTCDVAASRSFAK